METKNEQILRGEIYYVYPAGSTGSEQSSGRHAIIVSNDKANLYSPVVEVVYLTTAEKKQLPTHCTITSSTKPSTAMCEQVHSIDVRRLGQFIAKCTAHEMIDIDAALIASLGLERAVMPTQTQQPVGNAGVVSVEVARREIELWKWLYNDLVDKLVAGEGVKVKIKLDNGAYMPTRAHEDDEFIKDNAAAIKIKRTTDTAIIPERKTIGAAGYDLFIDSDKPVVIPPHSTVLVQSGIAFEIPKGYFGAVYARSGISTKEMIRPATCVSVIDSDYRGSVGLPLHNDSNIERVIEPYSRVAQIVFQKALIVDLELVESLEETERGNGGFGSTGK